MSTLRKGLVVAALQCLIALSLGGKLLYDRSTRPRVWVKTACWDPELPIRGRYLALQLVPESGAPYFNETNRARVLFFVPEHAIPLETMRGSDALEVWAEVTIPRKGPPRPIRLGVKRAGQLEPVQVN
jgi:hypothetical protein